MRLRDPGPKPAVRARARMLLDRSCGFRDQRALVGFAQRALALGIAAAVADYFGVGESGDRLRGVPVNVRIDEQRNRQLQAGEQFGEAEDAGPVAVIAPSVIEHVWLRAAGGEFGAEALAERKPFEIDGDIDGKPFARGP